MCVRGVYAVVGRLVLHGALAIAQGVNIACVVYNVAGVVSTAELTVLYVLIAPSCTGTGVPGRVSRRGSRFTDSRAAVWVVERCPSVASFGVYAMHEPMLA